MKKEIIKNKNQNSLTSNVKTFAHFRINLSNNSVVPESQVAITMTKLDKH